MDCPARGEEAQSEKNDSYLFRKAAEGCSLQQIPSDKPVARRPTGSAPPPARDDLTASSCPLQSCDCIGFNDGTKPIKVDSNDRFSDGDDDL